MTDEAYEEGYYNGYEEGSKTGLDMGFTSGYAEGLRAGKLAFHTEWGTDSPWGVTRFSDGHTPEEQHQMAAEVVKNMREAGNEAYVVWRGATDWHKEES